MRISPSTILFTFIFIIPTADAAQKNPRTQAGKVTCNCHCKVNTSEGTKSYTKYIYGIGGWTGTRAECKAFDNSTCDPGGSLPPGQLDNCDTWVHKSPVRSRPELKTPAQKMTK